MRVPVVTLLKDYRSMLIRSLTCCKTSAVTENKQEQNVLVGTANLEEVGQTMRVEKLSTHKATGILKVCPVVLLNRLQRLKWLWLHYFDK